MQRRAAAVYFVFFVVIGAAAYAYIGVAQDTQEPGFSLDGTTLGAEESVTIDGTEYTVAEVAQPEDGEMAATLEWTNESGIETATLENDSTVTYQDQSYNVVIQDGANASSFTLRQEYNVSQILRDDSAVENTTVTRDDTQYVVYTENDSIEPLAEYLPERQTQEFETGDTYEYEGNDTTVAEVTAEGVTLERQTPVDRSVEVEQGSNVTLADGQQYFAHFPSESQVTLVPSDQYGEYSNTVDQREYFDERMNGLWGVVIISALAALILIAAAYMPTRG